MNGSAFNMTKRDECQNSFQPIRSKPQQLPQPLQPQQPTLSQTLQSNKAIKETRDYIAEKKRASIGKYPPNLNVTLNIKLLTPLEFLFNLFLF